jgi:DNA mismatch repair protein MutL
MPIQSLSESDIRIIGSSLVLNDARSVIKELVDNALDAHADTISIEISADTVDIIQVKDNGSGIGALDRDLLCKRGCTSKIRTIQDLENLGGSSLGFRGEALSSVAGLSHAVLVTTRIEGDLVASTSKFGPDGQLLRQDKDCPIEKPKLIPLSTSSASHPVGTTVRVQNFLKAIPVRRQTALKAAPRTLTEIKKLLQAYAFARPTVRISFKVLKSKNDKYNWIYGPSAGSTTLLSATARIVGQEVAAQCEARQWKSIAQGGERESHIIDAVVGRGEGGMVNDDTQNDC